MGEGDTIGHLTLGALCLSACPPPPSVPMGLIHSRSQSHRAIRQVFWVLWAHPRWTLGLHGTKVGVQGPWWSGGVGSKGGLRPGEGVGFPDVPALPGPEARLTHPLAEGGEGVQALLILGRVSQLRVIAATALCGEKGDPVMGAQQEGRAEGRLAGSQGSLSSTTKAGKGAHSDGEEVAGAPCPGVLPRVGGRP